MTDLAIRGFNRLGIGLEPLRSVWGMIVFVLAAIAVFDQSSLGEHAIFAIRALLSTLPYVLFAVLMIGALKATGSEHMLARAFEGRKYQMIVLAALFGGLAPFCSCEVIPFIAGLIAAGVPLSAIMAFWLSSPLIDPPTVFITAAALGWDFAIGKMIFAVAIGLMGGVTIALLNQGGLLLAPARPGSAASSCGCGPAPGTGKPQWKFWRETERRDVFRSEIIKNGLFLMKWLAFAYLLESMLDRKSVV